MKITQSFVLDILDIEVIKRRAKKYDESDSAALRAIIREYDRLNPDSKIKIGGNDHEPAN